MSLSVLGFKSGCEAMVPGSSGVFPGVIGKSYLSTSIRLELYVEMESVFGFLFLNPCDQNSPGEAELSLFVAHSGGESSMLDMLCINS